MSTEGILSVTTKDIYEMSVEKNFKFIIVGIYFLIWENEIVYIGKSNDVYTRIKQHKDKIFDRYSIIECPIEELELWEGIFIHEFKPELNKNLPNLKRFKCQYKATFISKKDKLCISLYHKKYVLVYNAIPKNRDKIVMEVLWLCDQHVIQYKNMNYTMVDVATPDVNFNGYLPQEELTLYKEGKSINKNQSLKKKIIVSKPTQVPLNIFFD